MATPFVLRLSKDERRVSRSVLRCDIAESDLRLQTAAHIYDAYNLVRLRIQDRWCATLVSRRHRIYTCAAAEL